MVTRCYVTAMNGVFILPGICYLWSLYSCLSLKQWCCWNHSSQFFRSILIYYWEDRFLLIDADPFQADTVLLHLRSYCGLLIPCIVIIWPCASCFWLSFWHIWVRLAVETGRLVTGICFHRHATWLMEHASCIQKGEFVDGISVLVL